MNSFHGLLLVLDTFKRNFEGIIPRTIFCNHVISIVFPFARASLRVPFSLMEEVMGNCIHCLHLGLAWFLKTCIMEL